MHTGSSALADYKTALLIEGFSRGVLNVKNSSIDTVEGYGLFVEKSGTLRSFNSNSFGGINGTPVAVPGNQVNSSDVTNIMQNTVVRHGGHPPGFQGTQDAQANILIEGFAQGYLTLKDSTVADGAGYGVFDEIDATFVEEGTNTYNNLTNDDVHFDT